MISPVAEEKRRFETAKSEKMGVLDISVSDTAMMSSCKPILLMQAIRAALLLLFDSS